jgi:chromosome segregation ATPase
MFFLGNRTAQFLHEINTGKLERREMSLDELREAIQKRRAGEEMLAQAIDELKEERERREWKHRNWGFWADFTSMFADASKRRQLRDQDARMANEIAALNADIVKAKKTREDIRHKREELEAALAHRESEHDVDAEKALSDFEEYEARYRALEAEIEQLKQTMERISE